MKIFPVRILIACALLAFCMAIWFWMLGYFAIPSEMPSPKTELLEAWAAPGILLFPALVSVCAALAGSVMLLFFSYSTSGESKTKNENLKDA